MSKFTYPRKSVREGYPSVAFTRLNLSALHEGKGVDGKLVGTTFPDDQLGALFGCSGWEAGYARKHSAYWEHYPEHEEIEEKPVTKVAKSKGK